MAEDLTEYLHEQGIKVRYMHSDIDTLERIEIIRDLRLGAFDVLIGINLLREGLDIPECALVAILDADKEGFLRSETSLVQTIGRAARNVDGTRDPLCRHGHRLDGARHGRDRPAPREAGGIQHRPRHHAAVGQGAISPTFWAASTSATMSASMQGSHDEGALVGNNLRAHLDALEKEMRDAAADLDFERAAHLRDEIKRLQETELLVADDPLARDVGVENTKAKRAQTAKRGKAGGRASDSAAKNQEALKGAAQKGTEKSLFKKPELDEMTVGRTEKPATPEGWSPPRKTWMEDSRKGISTDGAEHGDPRGGEGRSPERDQASARGAGGRSPEGDQKRPVPRSTSGKPGQRGGFKANKRNR